MNAPTTLPRTDPPGLDGSSEPTLVFVHGAWHGPWCWEAWAAGARAAGFATAVPALPGHGRPGDSSRIWFRMRSYVRHVREVVESIDGPVVLVGHSMGGYVTQRVLEDAPAHLAAAVLVASVPRRGVAGATARLLRGTPGPTLRALLTADLYRIVEGPARTRRAFFTADTARQVVDATSSRLQNESYLAFPAMLLRFTRPALATVPVMVLAADADAIFSVRSERRLARAFGTGAHVVPGGHDVMLDDEAGHALRLVLDWVRTTLGS